MLGVSTLCVFLFTFACAMQLDLLTPLLALGQWVTPVAQYMLNVLRTNYLLQGLVGSMFMAWVSGALQAGVQMVVDAACACVTTCLTVQQAAAPREYAAVASFVRNHLSTSIRGNAIASAFDQKTALCGLRKSATEHDAPQTQYSRRLSPYLPTRILVDGVSVWVTQSASIVQLYVLGPGRFHVLRRALAFIVRENETRGMGFVVLMLDENLQWTPQRSAPIRNADTLAMDEETKLRLIDDFRKFFASKEHYAKHSRPWRRSHLYAGKPGCGKTSLAVVIASALNLPLCMLNNFSNAKLNDSTITTALCNAPSPGIILIDDVDCIGVSTEARSCANGATDGMPGPSGYVQSKQASRSSVTKSGFLSALDGPAAHDGHAIISTTNNLSLLDEALTRAGRLGDIVHCFSFVPSMEQYRALLRRFFCNLSTEDMGYLSYLARDTYVSFASLEALCVSTSLHLGDCADVSAIAVALNIQKVALDDLKRSGPYQAWQGGILPIWPDMVRQKDGAMQVRFREWLDLPRVSRACVSVNVLNSDQYCASKQEIMDWYRFQTHAPLTKDQQQELLDIMTKTDLDMRVLCFVLQCNLDSFEDCVCELREAVEFRPEYLSYTSPVFKWDDWLPFLFTDMTFEAVKQRCVVVERYFSLPSHWKLPTANSHKFTEADAPHMDALIEEIKRPFVDSPSRPMTRIDVAKALQYTKGLTTAQAWMYARRLCTQKRFTYISNAWFSHFLSTCTSVEEVVTCARDWEASYKHAFQKA